MQPPVSPVSPLEGFVRGRGRGRTPAGRDAMPPPKTPAKPQAMAGDVDGPAIAPTAEISTAESGVTEASIREMSIPDPHPPYADGPLTDAEVAELAACEDAIREQQLHFVWRVGRALHVISQGRLYRAGHDRFEDYLADNWDGISPPRAYQLIAAWPLAEKLAAGGSVDMSRVNEGQLRALAPVTRKHGPDAAVMVYTTVTETAAEIDGAKVTAKVISTVAGALPPGSPDRREVADQARRAFTAPDTPPPAERPWTATRDNAFKALRQIAAAGAGPAEVRAALTDLRRMLDEIEASLADTSSDAAAAGAVAAGVPES